MKITAKIEVDIDLKTSEWTKERLIQFLCEQIHNIDLLENNVYIAYVSLTEDKE